MKLPDFEQAKQYALERLERELSPELIYHSVVHTRDDVVPATDRLAQIEGIEGEDRMLLLTAAWFHDIGLIEQRDEHEAIGVRIASEVLPDMGYSPAQLEVISGIIMATHLPQTPHNLLQEIMADADLDSLGREDFLFVAEKLRDEQARIGIVFTDPDWYAFELDFLQNHEYFTRAAHQLRDAQKQCNIEEMARLLDESQNRHQ
jgi:uncharacterized protein